MSDNIVLNEIDRMLNDLIAKMHWQKQTTICQLREEVKETVFGFPNGVKMLPLHIDYALVPVKDFAVELENKLNGVDGSMGSYFNQKLKVEKTVRDNIRKVIENKLPESFYYLEEDIVNIGEKALEIMYDEWNRNVP